MILQLIQIDNAELERMSRESYDFARKTFTIEAYKDRLNEVLGEVIK